MIKRNTNIKKNCFIISRYNEDLKWLKKLKDQKIIIYNKGAELNENKSYKYINLKNVGRESHTWLYHIVKNYNCLDDVSVFLQGRIDDLGCMAFEDPLDYLKTIDKYGFSVRRFGLLGPSHWSHNIGIEKDIRYKDDWAKGIISKSDLGFRNFAKDFFPDIPLFAATSYGGCFGVKKELIKRHNLNFYLKLLKILESHKNPIEGHYMERLWCYMFTKNRPFWRSIKDVFLTKYERILLKK